MKRLPDSRVTSESLKNAARPFIDHSIEGLKTANSIDYKPKVEIVYPSSLSLNRKILLANGERAQTQAKVINNFQQLQGDCLHCGDHFQSGLPIAKYKSDGKFWIFGQFCSPSCGLGYLREHNESDQVLTWTREMFKDVFSIKNDKIHVNPPRFMLKRYGGPLTKDKWSQESFITTKMAPLSTFSMFAEVEHNRLHPEISNASQISFFNLQRPTERNTMPVKPQQTGREPILLKVLAEDNDGNIKKSPKRSKMSTTTTTKKGTKISTSLSAFLNDDI
jgi:hypothetical protein